MDLRDFFGTDDKQLDDSNLFSNSNMDFDMSEEAEGDGGVAKQDKKDIITKASVKSKVARMLNNGLSEKQIWKVLKEKYASSDLSFIEPVLQSNAGIVGTICIDCSGVKDKREFYASQNKYKVFNKYAINCTCEQEKVSSSDDSMADGTMDSYLQTKKSSYNEMKGVCKKTSLPRISSLNQIKAGDALEAVYRLSSMGHFGKGTAKRLLIENSSINAIKKAFLFTKKAATVEVQKGFYIKKADMNIASDIKPTPVTLAVAVDGGSYGSKVFSGKTSLDDITVAKEVKVVTQKISAKGVDMDISSDVKPKRASLSVAVDGNVYGNKGFNGNASLDKISVAKEIKIVPHKVSAIGVETPIKLSNVHQDMKKVSAQRADMTAALVDDYKELCIAVSNEENHTYGQDSFDNDTAIANIHIPKEIKKSCSKVSMDEYDEPVSIEDELNQLDIAVSNEDRVYGDDSFDDTSITENFGLEEGLDTTLDDISMDDFDVAFDIDDAKLDDMDIEMTNEADSANDSELLADAISSVEDINLDCIQTESDSNLNRISIEKESEIKI